MTTQNTGLSTHASPAPTAPTVQSSMSLSKMNEPIAVAMTTVEDAFRIASLFLKSGLLSRAINTPEKAFTIILAGAELGLKPFESLRHVQIVEGKPSLAADAQLALFKRAGGRATFKRLDPTCASLHLRHSNGDEHTETFTHAMAADAGLLNKDNWRKHKVAMMRSRVITAGLKSIGFMPTAGVYDPDEAEGFAPVEMRDDLAHEAATNAVEIQNVDARVENAENFPTETSAASPTQTTNVSGDETQNQSGDTTRGATSTTSSESRSNTTETSRNSSAVKFPYAPHKGVLVDARNDDGEYAITFEELSKAAAWCAKTRDKHRDAGDLVKAQSFADRMDGIEAEMERRSIQDTDTTLNGVGETADVGGNG